ncbi:FMN-binding negative transcriptional regulator [Variovorax sp. J22G73]|uniref:FMN-binding negative transcriptional regulator n=1 Tax=unclassified Variovorax TaxID=663243 RepID=UPI000D5DF5B4|nr:MULTISPECIES: FMN-binding negative transcriptional regulator [unclassified Variovorax]MDM0006040.1 FMN-binding negative transcriptional regulator [Variovorax sp. J22R203]MDM0097936.1 FMN-binding negative transcriptional regulator [Variovorax sp. J22G73]
MYTPKPYIEADLATLHAGMRAWSFATLVTVGPSGVNATHLPFLLDTGGGAHDDSPDGPGLLTTHLSKKNPQYVDLCAGGEALAIFQGPHAFVTPSWYVKQSTFPTWNYTAIHARGTPRVVEDRMAVHAVLQRTVAVYDTPLRERFGGNWDYDAMPFDFVAPRLDMIAAVEIPVRVLEGKFKLNQDRSEEDRRGVIAALERLGDAQSVAVAGLMRRQMEQAQTQAQTQAQAQAQAA